VKIVGVSNFNIDTVDDILIAGDVDPQYADFLAKKMNEGFSRDDSTYWYKVVPDDYELYRYGW
jgi:diketogulonate reductase-like aldo/keto reductase